MTIKQLTTAMTAALLLSGNAIGADLDRPAKSWNDVDVSDYNKTIENAEANGAEWVRNAMWVALYVFDDEAAFVNIRQEPSDGEGGEIIKDMTITAIYDGYLDDSVSGSRYELKLTRPNGFEGEAWKVQSLHVSYECSRGSNAGAFVAGPCP